MSFFKNKRIFITGHTGFKGAWLSQILLLAGANIKGYALEPEEDPSLYNILGLDKALNSVIADIRDAKKLESEITSFKPDIVLHLAAQPLVRRSYKEPVLTYETNVTGTLNLYEAVRKTPSVKSVINVSSDKCYENLELGIPHKESDPMGGFDPYSASKAMGELLTASYRNSFFNPKDYDATHQAALASVRAGNVIGGGDFAEDRILPDCARALSQKKEIVLRNPLATRPWQHVLEPLFGYLLLARKLYESPDYGSAWNFGPELEGVKTVEELTKEFIGQWGGGKYTTEDKKNPHEAKKLSLDISKARRLLEWTPLYDFKTAVDLTADWYKAFYEGLDVKELTVKQIKDYYGKLN